MLVICNRLLWIIVHSLSLIHIYTVKYVNVSSPVGYTYQIFIPATVNYGWGTTSSTLTITVNPNN